jgi:hypothetical protein
LALSVENKDAEGIVVAAVGQSDTGRPDLVGEVKIQYKVGVGWPFGFEHIDAAYAQDFVVIEDSPQKACRICIVPPMKRRRCRGAVLILESLAGACARVASPALRNDGGELHIDDEGVGRRRQIQSRFLEELHDSEPISRIFNAPANVVSEPVLFECWTRFCSPRLLLFPSFFSFSRFDRSSCIQTRPEIGDCSMLVFDTVC